MFSLFSPNNLDFHQISSRWAINRYYERIHKIELQWEKSKGIGGASSHHGQLARMAEGGWNSDM